MKSKTNEPNSARVRKNRRRVAKDLRDNIVRTIIDWEIKAQADLKQQKLQDHEVKYITSKIIDEAYAGLVWKALEPKERYNTSYHNRIIDELRKEHPDLVVENKIRQMVSWPVFRKEAIDAAIRNGDVLPLSLGDGEKSEKDQHEEHNNA